MNSKISNHGSTPLSSPQAHLIRGLSHHANPRTGYICNPLVLTHRIFQQRAARFLARLWRSRLPALAAFGLICAVRLNASSVTATLEPRQISLGEAAELTVSVQGQEDIMPRIPPVSGLSFQHVAQSSQIQIINGAMSASVTHTFAVVPEHDGTFTIPEIKTGDGRDAVASTPMTLRVLKQGNAAGLPPAAGSRPSSAVTQKNEGEENPGPVDRNSFGFLRLLSPRTEFYVGEMVPVELRAYFRAGTELRVDGLPQLNSDAFTMNKLSGTPARSQEVIDGVPYTIFSWATAITAVKAGDYGLAIQLPVTVTVRQRAARPRAGGNDPFDNMFDDSFFNSFFGTATQKQVVLNSQPAMAKILPLPTENRPAHFAGSVGKFYLTAEATPAQITAGDPVTLKLRVTGSGNFDRVMPPIVEPGDAWKSYKPGAKFSPADETGCTGEKTFEQALVPLKSGQLEIPASTFSYFDPEKKEYVTSRSPAITIAVAPGSAAVTPATPAPAPPPGKDAGFSPMAGARELNADQPAAGTDRANPWRWMIDPWFLAGGILAAVGFVAWHFIRHRPGSASDRKKTRPDGFGEAVMAQLAEMEKAAVRGATPAFFEAARRALQIRLGQIWNLPPQTITQAEINSRLNGHADSIRPIFEISDEVTYTGRAVTREELGQWRDIVTTALRGLDRL